MLRRLAVYVRRGLFVIGVAFLLLFPASYFLLAEVHTPAPISRPGFAVVVYGGSFSATAFRSYETVWKSHVELTYRPVPQPEFPWRPRAARFTAPRHSSVNVGIPLWQLALVCLAWPVTSFFGRRRQGRGFTVEDEDSGGTTL